MSKAIKSAMARSYLILEGYQSKKLKMSQFLLLRAWKNQKETDIYLHIKFYSLWL